MSFKLSNEAKAEKVIDVRENDKMYEKSTYIWQRFCAWSIHSTFRLRTLRTADLYNERLNLCGEERDILVLHRSVVASQNHLRISCFVMMLSSLTKDYYNGLDRESNPGPLASKARIMPLDQQARRMLRQLF